MFLESGARPVRRVTTLPPSVSHLSRQCGILNISQPYRPPQFVTGESFTFFFTFTCLSLWSSGQSSWLQTQRSGFDSRRYHIFREAVGLERGPLSLVSITEELLERKSSGSV
jgi:hypothetical protein